MADTKEKEISREQQIAFLKKINFFRNFDDNELRQFLAVSFWLKVPAGTEIIREQSHERRFYILVKGEVSVVKKVEEGETPVELTRLGTGDCFGEMSLVMDVKRTAGVIATLPSYLLMVEPDIINTSNVFLQLKFYKRFCEIMASRLMAANEKATGQEHMEGEGSAAPAAEQPKEKEKQLGLSAAEWQSRAAAIRRETHEKPVDLSKLPPMPSEDDRMGKIKLQRLISSDNNLPVSPIVEKQLYLYWSGGDGNTRKLAELIALDPVLSAKVLQVVNSPFYKRSSSVMTVPHAMIALGVDLVQTVVHETVEAQKERKYFSGFEQLYYRFWSHSIVVGRIAELLQQVIRVHSSLDLYTAGLLHDLGMLPLDSLSPGFYAQCLQEDSNISHHLVNNELRYIGIDHGTAGLWLGEKMGLPQAFLTVMQHHHDPQRARDHIVPVAIIHLANIFAARRGVRLDNPLPEALDPLDSYAWVMLQEQHKPFLDVNIMDFIASFELELENTWTSISQLPS